MSLFTFNKAQFIVGEEIILFSKEKISVSSVKIMDLVNQIENDYIVDNNRIIIKSLPVGNYGIEIENNGHVWEGAFDIVECRRDATRYGFLSDFSKADEDEEDVEWMKNLHINAIQFYDWMYRHDQMIPDENDYQDPLGREMSLCSVQKKIEACKKMGIRPFAYGAIYAASKELFSKHPDWGMYTFEGEPMLFADWLNYMNISKECGWTNHILREYQRAIQIGFEGIHMDTYGFPKKVWNSKGEPVSLNKEIPALIDIAAEKVKEENSEAGVIFNAVNDWPMEEVAESKQDAVYIEVWPPHDSYYDLYELIRNARRCSNKNVVLASYLKPFDLNDVKKAMWSWRLTWATICASGGTQLILGENKGILKDSYYVNYAHIDDESNKIVQRYCDFLVRYGRLLYLDKGIDITKTTTCRINEDICFGIDKNGISTDAKPDTVWVQIKESEKRISMNLINISGNDNKWNEIKSEPETKRNIEVKIRLDRKIKGIYTASPDDDSIKPVSLDYSYDVTSSGRIYKTYINELICWRCIWIDVEE